MVSQACKTVKVGAHSSTLDKISTFIKKTMKNRPTKISKLSCPTHLPATRSTYYRGECCQHTMLPTAAHVVFPGAPDTLRALQIHIRAPHVSLSLSRAPFLNVFQPSASALAIFPSRLYINDHVSFRLPLLVSNAISPPSCHFYFFCCSFSPSFSPTNPFPIPSLFRACKPVVLASYDIVLVPVRTLYCDMTCLQPLPLPLFPVGEFCMSTHVGTTTLGGLLVGRL